MLGVYLTPGGRYKKQVKILRGYAEEFKTQLESSCLSSSEAYCCYMIYIRPKLTYPFPCISLTEQQCRHIQAPVLEVILPRLHLNRHTPRAVLFASPRYGGFFQLDYPTYAKWIDSTWVTDVWKFTHRTQIQIEIENQWTPQLTRQHDATIMETALSFNLTDLQLQCINMCRLHLQVITLADLTTARGDRLTSYALQGQRNPHHTSQLEWPNKASHNLLATLEAVLTTYR